MINDAQTIISYFESLRSNGVSDLDLTFCDPEQWFSQTEEFYLTFRATKRSFSDVKSWWIIQIKSTEQKIIKVGVIIHSLGWIPRNFENLNFKPKLSFLRENHESSDFYEFALYMIFEIFNKKKP